ncbi:MAG: NUDIX domain-containing protein [Patescibacteria group bacterium]|nr:NUDIX domain-containing protein [Patescibacteria group bacterium]
MDIPLHVVFVEAWVKHGDKILLAKRSSKDDQAAGFWALPGGKVESGVQSGIIEDALKREVAEEVGLEISNPRYFFSRAFVRSSGHHVVALSFLVDYSSGEARALDDQEEVRWVTVEEAESLLDGHWKETLAAFKELLKH